MLATVRPFVRLGTMIQHNLRRLAPVLLAPLALAACAAPAYVSPVEVTRFVGATPAQLQPGPISIEPAAGLDPASLEFATYRDAVARELEMLGYTVSPGAPLSAVVGVSQAVKRPGNGRRSPVSVGGGASTGSYGSGVGVGVGINLNSLAGPDPDEIDTALSVTIRPAAGGTNLWEGRALMTATTNSDFAETPAAASRVASALFEGFPGNDGETIEVD